RKSKKSGGKKRGCATARPNFPAKTSTLYLTNGLLGSADRGTKFAFQCSPCMSLRADIYRQKAAEAKQSAARARIPSIKQAFEEVANGWVVLAEQTEWMDRQKEAIPEEKNHT